MPDTARTLPDAAARRRAATDFDTNLVVLAGAGTGKTSLLIERLLVAIGGGHVELDHLAAITFTEKAAGEMRVRLAEGLERLRSLAADEPTNGEANEADRAHRHLTEEASEDRQEIHRRALAAMESLDRARVTTIHGFCSELLRAHPVESGVDPDFAVDEGQQFESLFHVEWEAFLARELGSKPRRDDLWSRVLNRFPLHVVGEVARNLADFGVPSRLLTPPIELPSLEELFSNEVGRIVAEITDVLERQRGMNRNLVSFLETARAALDALPEQGVDGLRSALDPHARKVIGASLPATGARLEVLTAAEAKETGDRARRLLRDLQQVDDEPFRQLIEAIGPFVLGLRETALSRGFITFDAMLVLARDLLREHPAVRKTVKRRYRMLLVDEFQDTDPVQHEIVLLLAEEPDDAAGDPYSATLAPGRLFVVGDAKQSIYRFRGADYSAYRRAVDRIVECGGTRLDLVGNFRTVPGILEPVNRLFEAGHGAWRESPQQPDYVGVEAVRDDRGEPDVELWTVELPAGAKAQDRREAEGRQIAERIEQWVETDEICRYEEITILFRAFTNIAYYLRCLRERDIPFVVDGGRDFIRRPEVGQLIATLRTLSQPSDAAALLAFLRSAPGAVSDQELTDFATHGGRWSWHMEVEERFPTIRDRFRLLRELESETRHLAADAIVRRVVDRAELLPLGAAAYEGAQRVANLRKLAAAAGDLARDGALSLDEVVDALQEGRLIDIEADRPLADDAAEAVRITSIHRMKGLENRRIILPDIARWENPGRRSGKVGAGLARLGDGRTAIAIRANGACTSGRVRADQEDREHEKAEEVRVFYVALTRARDHLSIVVGRTGGSRGTRPWVDALRPWEYDIEEPPADGETLDRGRVLHRVFRPRRTPPKTPQQTRAPARDAVLRYEHALDRARHEASGPTVRPSGMHGDEPKARSLPAVHTLRDQGRGVGIVLHRFFERWDGDDAGVSALLRGLVDSVAEAEELDRMRLEQEASSVLERFLDSPLAERSRAIEIVGREVPLLMSDDKGATYHGSIDLVYRDSDGALVVADYKTDREEDDEVLRARYRDQLGVYAEAARKAFGLERLPRQELWILRRCVCLELD